MVLSNKLKIIEWLNMIKDSMTKEPAVEFIPTYHTDITSTANHGFLNSENLSKVIVANEAQDLIQNQSKLHFDNCCFKEGGEHIKEEWKNIEVETDHLSGNALTAFGRLLHTVQDFYSHSNWVEIHRSCDPIPVWDLDLENLPLGIVSGTWSLGSPKHCSENAPSHSQLNKDKPDSEEGSKTVSTGPNKGKTLFSLAREIAICATLEQFEQLKQLTKQR